MTIPRNLSIFAETFDPTTGIEDLSGLTGALNNPSGTTAQRPGTPVTGAQRWNTSLNQLEIYNGSTWSPAGSSSSTGNSSIIINNTNITSNATIAAGTNGFSVGPVTQANGVSITISSGQRWVVI